ncbi:hypothetical protein NM688_g5547 [Phlebia brevispora]|uniref:Uncharacterized protein n=1 Tax=Phlebia brevispora TaxID=194682 RepID=A0ACC1STW3_9APHY|nr:hypothetical protein NM688_g5547 [Phlebia brevispora]
MCSLARSVAGWNQFVNIANASLTIATDVVAIVITWLKTYRHVRQAAATGIGASLGATLLRYGALYFVVLCALNIAGLLMSLIPSLANPMTAFLDIIPNIVISRFLINLRQVNESPGSESSDVLNSSHFSEPRFRVSARSDIIGNLGEPLAGIDESLDDHEDNSDANFCEDCYNASREAWCSQPSISDTLHTGSRAVEKHRRYTIEFNLIALRTSRYLSRAV